MLFDLIMNSIEINDTQKIIVKKLILNFVKDTIFQNTQNLVKKKQ